MQVCTCEYINSYMVYVVLKITFLDLKEGTNTNRKCFLKMQKRLRNHYIQIFIFSIMIQLGYVFKAKFIVILCINFAQRVKSTMYFCENFRIFSLYKYCQNLISLKQGRTSYQLKAQHMQCLVFCVHYFGESNTRHHKKKLLIVYSFFSDIFIESRSSIFIFRFD